MIATADPTPKAPEPRIPSRRWAIMALFIVLLAQLVSVYVWPEITGPARLDDAFGEYGLQRHPTDGWIICRMTGLADPPVLATHVTSMAHARVAFVAQTETGHYLVCRNDGTEELTGSFEKATQLLTVGNWSSIRLPEDLKPPETFHSSGYWVRNLFYAAGHTYWIGCFALAICISFYRFHRPASLVNATCLLTAVAAGADLIHRSNHLQQAMGDGLILIALTLALLTLRRTGKEPPVESDDLPQPPMPFGPMPPRAN